MLLEMQDAFTKIAETVEPSVVNIKAERLRPADAADGEDTPRPRPQVRAEGAALPADAGGPARAAPPGSHRLRRDRAPGRLHPDQ